MVQLTGLPISSCAGNHQSEQDVRSSSRPMPITEIAADFPRNACAGAAAAMVSADDEVAHDAHQLVVTELVLAIPFKK